MKIIFLCGSLEPGQDGVGDYTRRLSGELIKLGHQVRIIALCDYQAICFNTENQMVEETRVIVNRIPVSIINNQRFIWVENILKEYGPDWISLQFVPYSFNSKGLPFWLPSFLKKLKSKYKWHIMFHELWLGIDIESSFKHKCIGQFQQLIIKKIFVNIKPNLVSTQNKLYQFFLESHNIKVDLLPICGNIRTTALKNKTIKFIQFVLFGTIQTGAPFGDFIIDLVSNKINFIKPIKFIFIGKNGSELFYYTTILDNYNICYEVMGLQSENVISQVLIDSDFGISTTPYFQTEKSGVYAAYREHKLTTISVSREWTPTKGQYIVPNIIKYEKNNLNIIEVDFNVFNLNSMAKQFINSISKI